MSSLAFNFLSVFWRRVSFVLLYFMAGVIGHISLWKKTNPERQVQPRKIVRCVADLLNRRAQLVSVVEGACVHVNSVWYWRTGTGTQTIKLFVLGESCFHPDLHKGYTHTWYQVYIYILKACILEQQQQKYSYTQEECCDLRTAQLKTRSGQDLKLQIWTA